MSNSSTKMSLNKISASLSDNLKFFLFFLAVIPAFLLGILTLKYGVNVPFWDQWHIAPLFEKASDGSLSFNDLIAQHNESRKLFPRFIFLSVGFLTHWNIKYEMLIIFLLACLVSINIYCLTQITVSGSTNKKLFIAVISNFLIFSPIQSENWLWGIQIVVFIPIVCLTSCLLILYSNASIKTKFFACVCLCTISTFSYANGILCWLLVLPILLLKSGSGWVSNKNIKLIVAWFFFFTINTAIYFYNYQKPTAHPKFTEALAHPLQAVQYFFSFLGSPIGRVNFIETLTATTIIGLVLFLTFSLLSVYILFQMKDTLFLDSVGCWLMIGMYTIISGMITASGRVGFGVQQSLSPRYTTFSVYLIVALIHLIIIIIDHRKNKKFDLSRQVIYHNFLFLFLGILLVLHLSSFNQGVREMSNAKISRLEGKSCLLFITILPQPDCLAQKLAPLDITFLQKTASSLDHLDLLQPGLVKSRNIQSIIPTENVTKEDYGWMDNLTKAGNDVYIASGWARLPHRSEPADSIILTYDDPNGTPNIFALVVDNLRLDRDDVAKSLNNNAYIKTGWKKSFSINELPTVSTNINAWAFDANSGYAYKLNGTYTITK